MLPIRILIVDDHVVVRKGIEMFLGTEPAFEVIGEAMNGAEAVQKVEELLPDVVLMDLVMPEVGGIEAITAIKETVPRTRVIVLTTYQDETRTRAALDAGADGYLLKDADGDALISAIKAVSQGHMPIDPHVTAHLVRATQAKDSHNHTLLTQREKEVLQLVAEGRSNRAIGRLLGLTTGTVKVHVSNILSKLDASSRTEAAMNAIRQGLIERPDKN